MKRWLRRWLGIEHDMQLVDEARMDMAKSVAHDFNNLQGQIDKLISETGILQNEIRDLRAEVTRLSIAAYVPPQTPEEKHKVIPTRTFKEFSAIVDRDIEELEARNAI